MCCCMLNILIASVDNSVQCVGIYTGNISKQLRRTLFIYSSTTYLHHIQYSCLVCTEWVTLWLFSSALADMLRRRIKTCCPMCFFISYWSHTYMFNTSQNLVQFWLSAATALLIILLNSSCFVMPLSVSSCSHRRSFVCDDGDCHHHFFKVEFILRARESYFSCYQKRSVA